MAPLSFLDRVKAGLLGLLERPGVHQVASHAVTAALAVIVVAVASGQPLSRTILLTAGGVAARIVLLGVESALGVGAGHKA